MDQQPDVATSSHPERRTKLARTCKIVKKKQKTTVQRMKKKDHGFMLPMMNSGISIRVENKGGLTNRSCGFSHWITGMVTGVKHELTRCIVHATYMDVQDYRGKLILRNDALAYRDFGRSKPKTWFVIPEDAAILKEIKDKINDVNVEKLSLSDDVQPLSGEIHDNSHYVPESICCSICKDGTEPIEKGTILICDLCNSGFHMNCANPRVQVMPAPKEAWFCPQCADMGL